MLWWEQILITITQLVLGEGETRVKREITNSMEVGQPNSPLTNRENTLSYTSPKEHAHM